MPDNPVVTVEIKGHNRAGKSTVAQLLISALRASGIEPSCEKVDPVHPAVALPNLKRRGLRVILIETETGPREQVECRLNHGDALSLYRLGFEPIGADWHPGLDTRGPAGRCIKCGLTGAARHDGCDRWNCPQLKR